MQKFFLHSKLSTVIHIFKEKQSLALTNAYKYLCGTAPCKVSMKRTDTAGCVPNKPRLYPLKTCTLSA